jgi:hypothetical protein
MTKEKSEPFPIIFEGTELPLAMCYVDVAALYDYIPNFPEETSEWLWRFTICLDREREDQSKVIQQHVSRTLELIAQHRETLYKRMVAKGRDTDQTKRDIKDWEQGLAAVLTISKNTTPCKWIGIKRIAQQSASVNGSGGSPSPSLS